MSHYAQGLLHYQSIYIDFVQRKLLFVSQTHCICVNMPNKVLQYLVLFSHFIKIRVIGVYADI